MRDFVLPFKSGFVSTAFKLLFDVLILYFVERILDYVEARISRRRLATTGRYIYSRRKLRLPIVGRLDIGGDSQIRAKRRATIFLVLFIVTAALELNINGTTQNKTRPLRSDEVSNNEILIRPRQPVTSEGEIRLRLLKLNASKEWDTINDDNPTTVVDLEFLSVLFVERGVQFEGGNTILLRSILTQFEKRNVSRYFRKSEMWLPMDVKHVNARVDIKIEDTFSGAHDVSRLLKTDTVFSEIIFDCKGLLQYRVDVEDYERSDGSEVRMWIEAKNETMQCEEDQYLFYNGSSQIEKEVHRKRIYCSRTVLNDKQQPVSLEYYHFDVDVPREDFRQALSNGLTEDKRISFPDKNTTCYRIGERTSAYPIPFSNIRRTFTDGRISVADNKNQFQNIFLCYWYSLLYPTKNVSNFGLDLNDHDVTVINVPALFSWIGVISIVIIYLVAISIMSLKQDKIGDKFDLNLEEAADIAGSWRSEMLGNDDDTYMPKPQNSTLVLSRTGPRTMRLSATGSHEPVTIEDEILGK